MASVVDVCNIALSHLGAEAQVASISPPDGSVEAGLCARFYPIARKELLEDQPWAFAKKRVKLPEVTNPSTIWSHAYAMPADCVTPLRVLRLSFVENADLLYPAGHYGTDSIDWRAFDEAFTERGSADFEVESGVLLTHEPEAVLVYVGDVTDTTRFDAKFTSALGMLLASYLAGPIIKGREGVNIGMQWRQAAYNASANAAASSANASSEVGTHVAEHLRGRG